MNHGYDSYHLMSSDLKFHLLFHTFKWKTWNKNLTLLAEGFAAKPNFKALRCCCRGRALCMFPASTSGKHDGGTIAFSSSGCCCCCCCCLWDSALHCVKSICSTSIHKQENWVHNKKCKLTLEFYLKGYSWASLWSSFSWRNCSRFCRSSFPLLAWSSLISLKRFQ